LKIIRQILAMTILLASLAYPAFANQKAQFIKENLCEKFTGVFYWENSNSPQYVNAYVRNITLKSNLVIVKGTGDYVSQSGVTFIKFEWVIDADTNFIEIQESEPTSSTFVTDGTYEGQISHDLIKINTLWETRSTGQKGTLNLNADKTCEPLSLS